MMKRNDLIKRFEETAKQEIINHNRAIEASNGTIFELSEKVRQLMVKLHEVTNTNHNKISTLCSEYREKHSDFSDKLQHLDSRINDCFHSISIVSEYYNRMNEKIIPFLIDHDELVISRLEDFSRLNNLEAKIKVQTQDFDAKLERAKDVLSTKFENCLQEISLRPKEMAVLEDGLSYHIDVLRCDQTCLKDELEIFKTDVKYMKKQIENIYTLLERLTKK